MITTVLSSESNKRKHNHIKFYVQGAVITPKKSGDRLYFKDFSSFEIYGIREVDNRKKAEEIDVKYNKEWAEFKKLKKSYLEGKIDKEPDAPFHPLEGHVVHFDAAKRSITFYERLNTLADAEDAHESRPDKYEADDVGRVVPTDFGIEQTALLTERDVVRILESGFDIWGDSPIKQKAAYSRDRVSIPVQKIIHELLTDSEQSELSTLQESIKDVDRVFESEGSSYGIPLYMYATNRTFRKLIDGIIGEVAKVQKGDINRMEFEEVYSSNFSRYLIAQDYSDNYKSLASKVKRELDELNNLKPEDAPKIPHVNKKFKLMPHQAYALAVLDRSEVGIVSVATGGGKTGILALDALNWINKGKVKRPLIVMPTQSDRLPMQQKAQIEKVITDGMINVIGITSKSFSQMGSKPKERYKALKKMVDTAPPNTIILTTYEWLRNASDNELLRKLMEFKDEDTEHDYERAFWMIKELGVDYVALDESHKIRHESTGAAGAAMTFASVPIRRIASGTMIMNNPEDLHRQITFLDPSIFGTKDLFLRRYASNVGKGKGGKAKALGWREGSPKEIQKKLKDNGAIQVDRSHWLHLLPKMVGPTVHRAVLTSAQQAVYKEIFEEVFNEIEREASEVARDEDDNPIIDPKTGQPKWKNKSMHDSWERFKNMSTDDDEDLEEAGPSFKHILAKLSVIDAFINSPDLRPNFEPWMVPDPTRPGKKKPITKILSGNDLISPKVQIIDEILENHFADPKNGKVILMMRNKVAAKHIAEHLKRKGQAVYYWAGRTAALDEFLDPKSKAKIMSAADEGILHGFNFNYVANRVVRVDIKWNPGDTDQGWARIWRPGSDIPGRISQFDKCYIDLVLCDQTIDVTKYARFIWKENYARQINTSFESMKELPPIVMNMDFIAGVNSLDQIQQYHDHYVSMFKHEETVNEQVRSEYGDKLYKVRSEESIKGAKKIKTPDLAFVRDEDDEDEDSLIINLKKDRKKMWLEVAVDDLEIDPTILRNNDWKLDKKEGVWYLPISSDKEKNLAVKNIEGNKVNVYVNDPGASEEEIVNKAIEEEKDVDDVREEEVEEKEQEESEDKHVVYMDIYDSTEDDTQMLLYLRLARNKDDLPILKANKFRYHGKWYYYPVKSKSDAIRMFDRIHDAKIHIDNAEDMVKYIRTYKSTKLKPGLGKIELTTRMPKKKAIGKVTVYLDWKNQKPYLVISEKEATADLTRLRGLGFKHVDPPMYWRKFSGQENLRVLLKKLRKEGIRSKNWSDFKAGLKKWKIKLPKDFTMEPGEEVEELKVRPER